MTEEGWRKGRDPSRMLADLKAKRRITERKNRLFLCGCCRLIWDRMPDERSRRYVEGAEDFADGLIDRAEFRKFRDEVGSIGGGLHQHSHAYYAAVAAYYTTWSLKVTSRERSNLMDMVYFAAPKSSRPILVEGVCDLVRDLFETSFRPEPFSPEWLTPTAVDLARNIYDHRSFGRMPILGDALEESGCTSPRVLDHCRGREPHARGCWVLDGLLSWSSSR